MALAEELAGRDIVIRRALLYLMSQGRDFSELMQCLLLDVLWGG